MKETNPPGNKRETDKKKGIFCWLTPCLVLGMTITGVGTAKFYFVSAVFYRMCAQ